MARLDRKNLVAYHGDRFHGGNIIFSAAGNLDHDSFAEAVAGKFSALAGGETLHELPAPEPGARIVLRNKKSLEQVQICLGVPAPPITDDNRYATLILEYGAGRRHELAPLPDHPRGARHGLLHLLRPQPLPRHRNPPASMPAPRRARRLQVVDLILDEFRKLKQEPLSEEELTRAKDQVKGNILMGLESSNARMANLARQEMYFHEFITVEEIIARICEVDAAQVQAMAQQLFDPERIAVTLLGRLDGVKLERTRLVC